MTAPQSTDTGFELASALFAAWSLADTALRVDLEQTIRAYVQRQPHFVDDLREVIAVNEQLYRAHDPHAAAPAAFAQMRIVVRNLTDPPNA